MDDITNSQEFIVADRVTGAVERHGNSRSGDVFARPPQRLWLGLTRGEMLARGLALVGALLFAISLCLPWVIIGFRLDAFGPLFLTVIQRTPQRLIDHLGADTISLMLHGAIPAVGIVLGTLLWRTLDNQRARLAVGLFGVWTVLCTLFTLFSIERLLTRYQLFLPSYFMLISGSPHVLTGFWLALVSLVVQWVAVMYLVREMLRTRVSATAPSARQTQRSWQQISGALVLTVGVPLWGVSYFMLYWATASGCSVLPFVQKFCNGRLDAVDGLSGLSAVISTHIDPLLSFSISTLFTIFFLLVTLGGGGVMVSAWMQTSNSMQTVWLALWVVLSAFLTGYAAQGILRAVAIPANGDLYIPGAGQYTLAPGMYLACLAVVVNLLAVFLLWQAEHRATPSKVAPTARAPVIWG